MMLLTKAIRKTLPPLYSTENLPDPLMRVKFYTPDAQWTWYASEFDGYDTFFGFVEGEVKELGYFSLAEMQAVRGKFGLPVERDRYFTPTPLSHIRGKQTR